MEGVMQGRSSSSAASGALRITNLARRGAGPALAREHVRAAVIVFAVVLAELWPALVGGRLLAPTTYLYLGAPWGHYTPADLRDYFNPLLIDVPAAYYPWASLARDLIRHGVFPAWNPYAFAGTPFFSNPQPAWFSPFSLPLWILPLNYALGVAAALKLWFAGFGTYLLVRELRLGFWPGILAGLSFMLCAFNVVWMTHGVLVSVAALLPWMVWLTERIIRRGRLIDGVALAAASAFAFSGGHPGTDVHVAAAVALYALIRTRTIRGLEPRERRRRLAIAGGGVALGALLLAVTLLPALLATSGTAGELARRNGGILPGATMPSGIARTIMFPDWWGRPSAIDFGGPANYNERTLYAGTVAVLLGLAGLLARGAWRRKAPFAVLAAIGLAAPLDVQPVHALLTNVPVFDSVQNQRMLFLFMFAAAVLAAFGAEAVLQAPRPRWRTWATWRTWGFLALGVLAPVVAFISIGPTGAEIGKTISHFTKGTDYALPHVIELTSVGWWVLLTVGITLVLALRTRWPRLAPYAPALLAAVDMLHFAHGYQPMGPPSKAIPPRTPAVRYLQRHAATGRVAGLGGALLNDWTTVDRLRDVRGYDPPQPSLRFEYFWQLLNPQQVGWQPYEITRLDPAGLRLLSILGARYLVGPPGLIKLGPGAFISQLYNGPDAAVYGNPGALPRALVARSVRVVDGPAGVLAALVDRKFDPRRQVLIERDQPGAARLAATAGAGGRVAVAHDANAEVRLRASLPRSGVVMLDDQLASGWTVRVDGRPAPALRVDGLMRGVAVPAGTHSVVWSYAVPGLRAGVLLSGLGLLGMLAGIGFVWVGRRRTARRQLSPGADAV
jgi:hypothetical protein